MDFLILNRYKISRFCPEIPYIVISITEPENTSPKIKGVENKDNNCLGVLHLKYTDEDDFNDAKFYGKENQLFTDDQAIKLINFVNNYKDQVKCIVCQCDGGISRSSGTAAALSVILNGPRSDKWIFDSPMYVPNMFVYRKILNNYFTEDNDDQF